MYSIEDFTKSIENEASSRNVYNNEEEFIKKGLRYYSEEYNKIIKKFEEKLKIEKNEQNIDDLINNLIEVNKVYLRHLKNELKKLNEDRIEFNIPIEFVNGILRYLNEYEAFSLYKYDTNLTLIENVKNKFLFSVECEKYRVEELIYKLKKIPFVYINKQHEFINNNLILLPYNQCIIYKEIYIAEEMHYKLLFYNNNTNHQDKTNFINILAFIYCKPMFLYLGNINYSNKLESIYSECDIMESLRLRNKKYLREDYGSFTLNQKVPILKEDKRLRVTILKEIKNEHILELFELYNSSLKQVEPLPRCVFLYRVFEKGVNIHYKSIVKPTKYVPNDALNFYYERAMKHRFIPVYYFDNGWDKYRKSEQDVRQRNPKLKNFMIELKKESKKIKNEWSKATHLKNKSIGDIIYEKGRCLVAHGGGNFNSKYDYSKSYLHINDINIFLELICRYIIEIIVPDLKKYVETKEEYYLSDLEKEMIEGKK